MKIKSKSTNTTVTKNNNFVGKTFNFTKLNNKYIVAATNKIERSTKYLSYPIWFLFIFSHIKLSLDPIIILQKKRIGKPIRLYYFTSSAEFPAKIALILSFAILTVL